MKHQDVLLGIAPQECIVVLVEETYNLMVRVLV
jgi:hypothetical protein